MFGFTKTKAGILIASAIFLVLILLGELSPLGEMFQKNGITRGDVAKYRIHVMSTPTLKKLSSKDTSLNVTAKLKQLGNSNFFRADGGSDFYAYCELTRDWDFKFLDELDQKRFFNKLFPVYSLNYQDESLSLQKLDKPFRSIKLQTDQIKNPKIITFNYNRSAIMTWLNKDSSASICLLKDITKSPLEYLKFGQPVSNIVIDKFGSKAYAISFSDKTSKQGSISYIDASKSSLSPLKLETSISRDSQVSFSSIANSICILDSSRLRILNAESGKVTKILYLKDFDKEKKSQRTDTHYFEILDKVPAAFLDDKLIDLRDGSTVDSLPGLTEDSIYAIDYKNKNLYYSPMQKDGELSMNIATYDLHNLRLTQQIKLGTKTTQESKREERDDVLSFIFIDANNNLVGLSKPKQ